MNKERWEALKRKVVVPVPAEKLPQRQGTLGFQGALVAKRQSHKTGQPTKNDGMTNAQRVASQRKARIDRVLPYI